MAAFASSRVLSVTSSFHLHPSTSSFLPGADPGPCAPGGLGRGRLEIRIVKEQCRLSLRESCGLVSPFAPRKCGFRGAKGKVSTVIYARPTLIFKSVFVTPCHEPRYRTCDGLPRPHRRHERPDRQGNRFATSSWAVPFQSASAAGLKTEDPACPRLVPLRSGTKLASACRDLSTQLAYSYMVA